MCLGFEKGMKKKAYGQSERDDGKSKSVRKGELLEYVEKA
jgi:hypothetical protein